MAYNPAVPLLRMLVLVLAFAGAMLTGEASAAGRWCSSSDVVLFGNHAVGSTTTSNVTVTNCGDQAWSFTDVNVHSATGPAFHVSTSCATGLSLAPGQSCTASIVFAPTSTGQTSGALWLRNTTNTPTQLLTFYGRGIDAQVGSATLIFLPAAAAFASQEVGKQSAALTIELHNLGPTALTPSAIVLNGPEVYDYSGAFPSTCALGAAIPAGGSCLLSLMFKPQGTGT